MSTPMALPSSTAVVDSVENVTAKSLYPGACCRMSNSTVPFGASETPRSNDPERLKAYAAFGLEGEDWTKLLERSRVVILAEAGTGKTHELRETARRLRVEGKASFFCRFDDLAEIQLADALEEGDIKELEAWLSGEEQGWFFLLIRSTKRASRT